MRKFHSLKRQAGLSMVEVLVAFIIFAFGLLGAAGLQLATLRSNQFAASSSMAVSMAREYGELMQSFPNAVVSTTSTTSTFFVDTNSITAAAAANCTGSTASCSANDIAAAAISDWSSRVKAALPGGRAAICRDSTPRDGSGDLSWDVATCDELGDLVIVKLGWNAKNDKGETLFTADRPRLALPVMGNLQDFAAP
jgi:type IV pilus assembly protein PilV